MAIANRTLDPTQKNMVMPVNLAATATGITVLIGLVPQPSTYIGGQMAAYGVSGSPQIQINVGRFIAGAGYTTWPLATGTSNVVANYGTSGPGAFGASLFGASAMISIVSGSTLANLQANDLLFITTGGANSAVVGAHVGVVIQPIQDLVYRYGAQL